MSQFTEEEIKYMRLGGLIHINSAIYSSCFRCNSIVKINKFIFGSIHFCKR